MNPATKSPDPFDLDRHVPFVMKMCGGLLVFFHLLTMVIGGVYGLFVTFIASKHLPLVMEGKLDLYDVYGPSAGILVVFTVHYVLFRIGRGIFAGQKQAVLCLAVMGFLVLGGTIFLLTSENEPIIRNLTTRILGLFFLGYLAFLYLPSLVAGFTSWRKLT